MDTEEAMNEFKIESLETEINRLIITIKSLEFYRESGCPGCLVDEDFLDEMIQDLSELKKSKEGALEIENRWRVKIKKIYG